MATRSVANISRPGRNKELSASRPSRMAFGASLRRTCDFGGVVRGLMWGDIFLNHQEVLRYFSKETSYHSVKVWQWGLYSDDYIQPAGRKELKCNRSLFGNHLLIASMMISQKSYSFTI